MSSKNKNKMSILSKELIEDLLKIDFVNLKLRQCQTLVEVKKYEKKITMQVDKRIEEIFTQNKLQEIEEIKRYYQFGPEITDINELQNPNSIFWIIESINHKFPRIILLRFQPFIERYINVISFYFPHKHWNYCPMANYTSIGFSLNKDTDNGNFYEIYDGKKYYNEFYQYIGEQKNEK